MHLSVYAHIFIQAYSLMSHNLERRDMMLLGSLTENIFGFAGTYARKQQASLAPILTGWKRWMEFNTTSTEQIPEDGWHKEP